MNVNDLDIEKDYEEAVAWYRCSTSMSNLIADKHGRNLLWRVDKVLAARRFLDALYKLDLV